MQNQWSGVTVDCREPELLATFWSALLERPVTDEMDGLGWRTVGSRLDVLPRLNFQKVPEPRRGKVRIHLDVTVADIDAGMQQVAQLGGQFSGARYDYAEGVVAIMLDRKVTTSVSCSTMAEGPRGTPRATLWALY